MLYLKAPRWFSCAAWGSPPSRFPGKALPPGSLGNLKTLNSPRKQVLPHFLPVPVLRNRPSSLGGRRVKTRPRLAGRTLGLWESKFTRTLLGQVYQTLGMPRLTHLQQILGCFPAFSETFLWKTGRAGAGGKAGFEAGGPGRVRCCCSRRRLVTCSATVFTDPEAEAGRAAKVEGMLPSRGAEGQTATPPPPEEVSPGSPEPSKG